MANPGTAWFFGAPTYKQGKMIAWNALKGLSPACFVKVLSESELRIEYVNGSEIWVIGFDARQRFEGKERWNGGVLDEYASMDEEVWTNTVRPALADTLGPCHFIGKPEGRNHYFELSEYARTSGDPEWGDYNWYSADILDKNEIAKIKETTDERTFRQEYEGSFESYEGRAYVYYSSDTHRFTLPFSPSLPVCLCLDFNIDPCLWELAQDNIQLPGGKRGTYFFREIKQRQTDIWRMCVEAKRVLGEVLGARATTHRLIFYGDYTSASRRDVSAVASSWKIVQDEFRGYNADFRQRPNPRIIDRVNAVNSRLRSADGGVHIGFHPSCVELNKDMEMVDMEMLTTTKGQVGDRTHASDAAGYFIHSVYPVISNAGRLIVS